MICIVVLFQEYYFFFAYLQYEYVKQRYFTTVHWCQHYNAVYADDISDFTIVSTSLTLRTKTYSNPRRRFERCECYLVGLFVQSVNSVRIHNERVDVLLRASARQINQTNVKDMVSSHRTRRVASRRNQICLIFGSVDELRRASERSASTRHERRNAMRSV